MRTFQRLSSRALTILEDNLDTDVIFPARFLLMMEKDGLGRYLFHDRRFTASGGRRADSRFDRPDRANAAILIAGTNFGCGSSREHAVWALAGFGIRCIVAPTFGEIFRSNCFNNGVLPVMLPKDVVIEFGRLAEAGEAFDVDLERCVITTEGGLTISFKIDASSREALLRGEDVIDRILGDESLNIDRFEMAHARLQPWLFE